MRALALLPILLTGCDLDGNGQTYPGASVYEAPDEGFHFHFLSPPWRYHAKKDKHLVHLVVDSFSQYRRSSDVSISHKLWASYSAAASPQQGAASLRDEAVKGGRTITRDVELVTTLTGEQGWQFMAHADEKTGRFYHRHSLFRDANARIVLFTLYAAYPLDEQGIDDLILSFSAGPDPGTETPPRKDFYLGDTHASTDAWMPDGGSP